MTVSLLNCLHVSRCDLLHVWNSWKHTYSSALRCIKEGRSMWLGGCCLVSTDSLHETATCILLFMCFVSSGSFQTGSTYWVESAVRRSGPGRRQQPHYELLLHPNLASSQQQGERVQKPEWQEDITKTFEWVTYPQWLLWWAHRNPSQCLNACCSINLAYLENHLIITVEMLFSCDKKKKKILRDFQVKVKYIKQN